MPLQYWYMFPVSMLFATAAIGSGIEGSTFFTPLFILGLDLPTNEAVAAGLMIQVFGFASGFLAYSRRKLIDYRLGGSLLLIAVPMTLLGAWGAHRIPAELIKAILGVVFFVMASGLSRQRPGPGDSPGRVSADDDPKGGPASLHRLGFAPTAGGAVWPGLMIAGGGLLEGLISTGLGGINAYLLLRRCRMSAKRSVATNVLVVLVASLTASIGHGALLLLSDVPSSASFPYLLLFSVPGVILGGQIGPYLAARLTESILIRSLVILFIVTGALLLGEIALNAI